MEEEEDITQLKYTLDQQTFKLLKCQAELEEEREASASAASEALSMILRLQGEKANEKMEACQYKRMAEERMRHAEESLVLFEDLLYQKELEIVSLRIQIQEYMDKLPSTDSEVNENEQRHSSNQILKSTNSLLLDKNSSVLSRRSSLPVLQLQELCSQIDSIDRELHFTRPPCPAPKALGHDGMLNKISSSISTDKLKVGNIVSYFEQIEEAKRKAKEFDAWQARNIQNSVSECAFTKNKLHRATTVDFGGARDECKYPSKQSEADDRSCPQIDKELSVKVEERLASVDTQQKAMWHPLDSDEPSTSNSQISRKNSTDSVTTHDILEVQQDCGTCEYNETGKDESPSASLIEKGKGTSIDQIQKDATDKLKLEDALKSITPRSNLSPPRHEAMPLGFHFSVRNYKSFGASPRSDFQQFEKRLQIIEERVSQQQIFEKETEQLMLIKEIHKQLNEIWSCLKDRDSKKDVHRRKDSSSVQDDEAYLMLMKLQAMLSVSI